MGTILSRIARWWLADELAGSEAICQALHDSIDVLEERLEKQRAELRQLYNKIEIQNKIIFELRTELNVPTDPAPRPSLWKRYL